MEERHYIFDKEQRGEIKSLVSEAMVEYFESKGKMGKQWVIGAAVVIGSITVILGGVKTLLGWLGFHLISKP